MPPYTFVATITGACGFVPNKPLADPDNPPTRLRVMMPDGTVGVRSQRVYAHYPFVKVRVDDLISWKGLPPSLTFKTGENIWYSVFLPFDWDMEFIFDAIGWPQDLQIVNGVPVNPENPVGNEQEYFFFLAAFEDVAPSASFVDHTCFQDGIDGQRVRARLAIDSGEVKVAGLTMLDGEFVVWEFRPENSDGEGIGRKVLANAVSVSRIGLSEPTTIRGYRVTDGQPEEFTITLRPPDGDSSVSIEIGNAELEKITGVTIPGAEQDPDELDNQGQYVARDLKVVYRLSQQVDPSMPLPSHLPLAHAVVAGGSGRPVHCPFALYSAHPKA